MYIENYLLFTVKIHTRTLLILGATIFITVFVMTAFAQYFLLSSYGLVEKEEAASKMGIIKSQIDAETTALVQLNRDWAVWDDSYNFMEDRNQVFINDNFEPSTSFDNLRVNGFLFYNITGDYFSGEWYDLAEKRKTEVPAILREYFTGRPYMVNASEGDEGKTGFILVDGKFYLVSSYPILQSTGRGPARGMLVIVRLYDDAQIQKLIQRSQLPVRMIPITASDRFADPVLHELSVPDAPVLVYHSQNEKVSTVSSLIPDLEKTPAGILQVDFPRSAYMEGIKTLIFMTGGFLIIGICYVLVTEILLRRYMISPLMDLDSKIMMIGKKRDLSEHLEVSGDDEIASLKTSFNGMLQELKESQTALAESNRKANLYLDIYLDVVTYEILNTTNSMDGYAELIKSHGGEKEKDYAERILRLLNQNRSVIRNIETISTIFKQPPVQKRTYLASLVKHVFEEYEDISISSAGCEETVLADEKLEVVFHNIISNSIRFGGRGVEIAINARVLNDGMLEVSVTDTGPGIPDAVKPTIFDRFLENSGTRSSYGLGLHITKMLVEAYGGKIRADDRVEGHPEQGAAIRFTLKRG